MSKHRLMIIGVIMVISLIFGVTGQVVAQSERSVTNFTVNTTLDGVDVSPGDGQCSTSANKCSLRAAIMETNMQTSGTITIPTGTYALTITTGVNDDSFGDLNIYVPMTLNGAGAGSTIVRQTVTTGLQRVMRVEGAITVQMNGLTLTGGNAEGPDNDMLSDAGGGIEVVSGANVTLQNMILTQNNARWGGAAHCSQSTFTLLNSDVIQNRAGQSGGAVDVYQCDFTAANSLFDGNTSIDYGGAISGYESDVSLQFNTFQNNSASFGGTIGLTTSDSVPATLSLLNSRLYRNRATSQGGGIYVSSGGATHTVSVISTLFEENSATERGGGIVAFSSSSELSISRSAFIGNQAWEGGGVASFGVSTLITNSTFTHNTALLNGAAVRGEDTITLNHVTIMQNHSLLGGAVTSYDMDNPTHIENSIIAGNTSALYYSPECSGDFTSNGANFLGNWWCASEGTDMFGLPDMSGLTVPADSSLPAMIPTQTSLVVDAGLADDCAAQDQTGYSRFGTCDIGAIEVSSLKTNMVRNGGFENGMTDWKTASLSGDKRVCDSASKGKYPALNLSCSFQFSNPTGSLTQTIPAGLLPSPGTGFFSILRLSALVSTSKYTGLTPLVTVKFSNASGASRTITLALNETHGAVWQFSEGCLDFTPNKGKITVRYTASKGKVTVDDISLVEAFTAMGSCPTIAPAPQVRDGSLPLALPEAPNGFRGGN